MSSPLHRPVIAALAGPLLLLSLAGGGAGGGSGAGPPGPALSAALHEPGGPQPTARAPDDSPMRRAWRWPLDPRPTVLRRFVAPAGPYGPGHRGVDLRAGPGDTVLAVAAGVVTHAGRVAGRGTVTLLHPGGLASTYEPVEPVVETGARVSAGDAIGVVSPQGPETTSPGHCGPLSCLHLGARRAGGYLDPLLLLVGGRVRLLPLAPRQPTTG